MSKIKKEDVFDADYIAFVEKMNEFKKKESNDLKKMFIVSWVVAVLAVVNVLLQIYSCIR